MFGPYRNPYPYYYNSDPYSGYYVHPSSYQQAQAEQEQRARSLALEREREFQRQRELERQRMAAQSQRASRYLPESMMPRAGHYVPERASKYLPDEYAVDDDDDHDMDAYDYGLGRAGYYPHDVWPGAQRGRRVSNVASRPQPPSQIPEVVHQRRPSQTHLPPHKTIHTQSPSQPHYSPKQQPMQNAADHSIPIRTRSPAQSHPSTSKPAPSPPAQPQARAPVPPSPSPPPKSKHQYDAPPERLDEAATIIQTAFRIHRAFKTIQSLQDKFASLKQSFVLPTKLDYQLGNDHERVVSIPTSLERLSAFEALSALESRDLDLTTIQQISEPKLAYTHSNAPVHGYAESLNQLLISLDGVESFGEKKVREKRKAAIRSVEQEAARVESIWKNLWFRWTALLQSNSYLASITRGASGQFLPEPCEPDSAIESRTDRISQAMPTAEEGDDESGEVKGDTGDVAVSQLDDEARLECGGDAGDNDIGGVTLGVNIRQSEDETRMEHGRGGAGDADLGGAQEDVDMCESEDEVKTELGFREAEDEDDDAGAGDEGYSTANEGTIQVKDQTTGFFGLL